MTWRLFPSWSNRTAIRSFSRSQSSKTAPSDESFFKHTSRRWVFNEEARLKERYVRFNVAELQRVAAKAVNRDRCTRIAKMAEGGFNKIFLLTMDDGLEVIARIPTPIAGPPHFTTASEVATLDFLRNTLGVPVPKIFASSSTADNPVGAEYMIMERFYGESLASRWLSLSTSDIKDVMTQLAKMEEKMFSFRFPAYGSLYYKSDTPGPSVDLPTGRFCVGPIAKRQFWFSEREKMQLDRGPWMRAGDYLKAPARREAAWISQFAEPKPRRTFLLQTDHAIDPSEHVSLLSKYLLVAPYLVPEKEEMSSPTLRHPDLSLANVLLVPNSSKILGFIDWQDAAILPLFMQAGYPAFCENDLSRPQPMTRPKLPDEFDQLSADEKAKAKKSFRLEEANLYYTAATGLNNSSHLQALRLRGLGVRQYLFSQAGFPWDADFVNLKAALVSISRGWEEFSSTPCPISFSPEEQEKAREESAEWNESAEILSTFRDSMGIDPEGGTEPVNFEHACNMNKKWRMELYRHSEEDEKEFCWQAWPYKDNNDTTTGPTI
ncbi:hypothetical protein FQN54_006685 [Arachnomyces sp. PD_36]|nr:hypothetical protein FQN54_006685 [Arachnomyces sp. PD_36]